MEKISIYSHDLEKKKACNTKEGNYTYLESNKEIQTQNTNFAKKSA